MSDLKIESVHVIVTQPHKSRHVVVKVVTNQPGLYGLGCATFTQRWRAVETAVTDYLGPLVVGRDAHDIDDLWRLMHVSGYWRSGPVLNNAVSGIDMALWDIKGKVAGLPCYQLWGGKCRPGAVVYTHAGANDVRETADSVRSHMAKGFTHIRCQLGGYQGLNGLTSMKADGAKGGAYYMPQEKLRRIPALFEFLRSDLGDEVELLHDVHERLAPSDAVQLAKALEPYRLFFLEDILAPEDVAWFENIRKVCATPLAMGELFSNPVEYTPLITDRLIDFIRCHVSTIGGITPALKLAHLCETCGVRTAWHGPGDVSPVGMAANVHLDVASRAFGIQEWALRTQQEIDMFDGYPELKPPYVYPNDRPGLGIEIDEELAKKHPPTNDNPTWTEARTVDGAMGRP